MDIGKKVKKESTNRIKNRNRLAERMLVTSYLAIWAAALLVFWFFTDGSDAMGYGLLFLWILLPVTTFVCSLLIGKHHYWGTYGWFAAVIFGVMYMLAEYATFSAANMSAFGTMHMPRLGMILVGAAISLIGIGIGAMVSRQKDS